MKLILDGRYELHENGRIFNAKTGAEIYGAQDRYGFNTVKLRHQGQTLAYQRHRLIATHFLPNPKQLHYVHFKNGDKEDCRVENLYWGNRYPYPDKLVACYDFNGNLVKRYQNLWEAYLDGHHQGYVQRCLEGINKTYHQLIWRYDEGPTIDAESHLKSRWKRRAGHKQRKENQR